MAAQQRRRRIEEYSGPSPSSENVFPKTRQQIVEEAIKRFEAEVNRVLRPKTRKKLTENA